MDECRLGDLYEPRFHTVVYSWNIQAYNMSDFGARRLILKEQGSCKCIEELMCRM